MEEVTPYPALVMSSVATFSTKSFDNTAPSLCNILPPHNVAGAFKDIEYFVPMALVLAMLSEELETFPPKA